MAAAANEALDNVGEDFIGDQYSILGDSTRGWELEICVLLSHQSADPELLVAFGRPIFGVLYSTPLNFSPRGRIIDAVHE